MIKTISINNILKAENIKSTFARYDLLVIYLSIDRYLNGDESFDLYRKLQLARLARQLLPLSRQIKSEFIKSNLDEGIYNLKQYYEIYKNNATLNLRRATEKQSVSKHNFPIQLSKDFKLINGSHRLGSAIYCKEDNINSDIGENSLPRNYGFYAKWMLKYFSKEELVMFDKIKNKIIKERNV